RQRPESIAPELYTWACMQLLFENPNRVSALFGQLGHSPISNGKTGIVEERDHLARLQRLPLDRSSTRIGRDRTTLSTDAINGTFHLRLGDLRRGTAVAEPAARVNHQQRAVHILQDIGRVKVA